MFNFDLTPRLGRLGTCTFVVLGVLLALALLAPASWF